MRLLDDPLAVRASLGEQLLPIAHDPACALDLLGERLAHLRDHLQHLVAVDEDRGAERHRLGLADELFELLEASGEIHQRSSSRSASAVATCGGTSPATSPPSCATSFTSDDERNDHFGLVGMKSVSTPASRWFICAIWISYS